MKNHLTKILSSIFIFAISTVELFAQPGLPGAPDPAPIDGGLTLLAAAGGAYAVKKLRDKKRINDDIEE